MSTWTAPSEGTWHFHAAPGAELHRFEDCDERCSGPQRQGWYEWLAKGASVDLERGEDRPPGSPPVP